jgi:hypothetical protein
MKEPSLEKQKDNEASFAMLEVYPTHHLRRKGINPPRSNSSHPKFFGPKFTHMLLPVSGMYLKQI